MRILFALPGLHRVSRGAEIAFMAVANELVAGGHDVTLIGSGQPDAIMGAYRFLRAPAIPREQLERLPNFPPVRNETAWEEASFIPGFLRVYRPQDYDLTATCAYPFLNWTLRARKHRGRRPAHVFITQNGDWPARARNREYRFFDCDGLVGINPDYVEANKDRYRAALIPNGVDSRRFTPGPEAREALGLPEGVPIVLMVSAFIQSKNVDIGIEAVSGIEGAHLVVAGDGPLRDAYSELAEQRMSGRFHRLSVTSDRMPDLYRSADVFLHLSRDESFGNVYVEAMACGLPTVAWDLPRTRWITGDTASLVPDGDVPALRTAIAAALIDDRSSTAQVERAKQFDWRNIATKYEQFFATVVSETPMPPGDK